MAYKVIILYQLYMPSYFLGTFTEYPFFTGLRAQLSFKGQVSQVLHDSSFFKAFSFL